MDHEYVYFYLDKLGNQVPVETGTTNDLQQVLWMTKKNKQAMLPAERQALFVWIDNQIFIVKDYPALSSQP